jgi:hypothetical protein
MDSGVGGSEAALLAPETATAAAFFGPLATGATSPEAAAAEPAPEAAAEIATAAALLAPTTATAEGITLLTAAAVTTAGATAAAVATTTPITAAAATAVATPAAAGVATTTAAGIAAAARSACTCAYAGTTAAAGRAFTSLVHVQITALKIVPVELLDRLLGLFVRAHLDEAEAAGFAGQTVHHHRGPLAGSGAAEQLLEVLAGGSEIEVAYEKPSAHRSFVSWQPSLGDAIYLAGETGRFPEAV